MLWTKINLPNGPGPRAAHIAVTVSKSIVIFGGRDSEGHASLGEICALVTDESKNIVLYREELQDIENMK
jgi:hypothetical protein